MWRAVLFSGVLLIKLQLHGQGTVYFANGPSAPVINSLTGQPVPQGDLFHVALYHAPDGTTDEGQFLQIGNSARIAVPGVYAAGLRTVPTSTPGGFVMLQVRAWETAYGVTYEEALAAPPQNGRLALTGRSIIVRYNTCPIISDPICDPPPLTVAGMQGFPVIIPEPGVLTLLIAGTLIFSMCRLKRKGDRRQDEIA